MFRDTNVCSAIPLFDMPCAARWATLQLGGRQRLHAGERRPTWSPARGRQLLANLGFHSGGTAPMCQVQTDSQLSAGLDALTCTTKSTTQTGVGAGQFERGLGVLQHGDGLP